MNQENDLVVDDVLAAMQADSLYGLDFGSDESDLSEDEFGEEYAEEPYMDDEGRDDIGIDGVEFKPSHQTSHQSIELELQAPFTRRGSADSAEPMEPVGNKATAQEVREARAGTVEEALKFAGGFGPWHWQHFLMTSAIWFCISLAMSAHPPVEESMAHTQRLFQASGAVLGTAAFGYAADVVGRMRCCYWGLIITVLAGIGGIFAAPSGWGALAVRFMISLGGVAACACYFILLMEYVPFSHRLGVACVVIGSGAVAESTGHTVTLFVKHSWVISFIGVAPSAVLLIVVLISHDRARRLQRRDLAPVAESARWLLAEDKDEAAVRWMAAVAMRNRARLDPSIIFMPEELRSEPNIDADLFKERKTLLALAPPESRIDVLFSPVLWRPTCGLLLLCAAVTTSQCVGQQVSAIDFNDQTRIVEMVSVPFSQIAAVYLTNMIVVRHGRRKAACGFVTFTGFFNIMVGFTLEQDQFVLLFNLAMARVSITGATIVTYVLLIECIPTIARGTGVGVVLSVAWTACMIAELLSMNSTVTSIMFAVALCGAAAPLCLFWIPETKRLPLPDVLPDTSIEQDNLAAFYAQTANEEEEDGMPMMDFQEGARR